MTHLWEPLRVMPKPLLVPLASEATGLFTRLLLKRQVRTEQLSSPPKTKKRFIVALEHLWSIKAHVNVKSCICGNCCE